MIGKNWKKNIIRTFIALGNIYNEPENFKLSLSPNILKEIVK